MRILKRLVLLTLLATVGCFEVSTPPLPIPSPRPSPTPTPEVLSSLVTGEDAPVIPNPKMLVCPPGCVNAPLPTPSPDVTPTPVATPTPAPPYQVVREGLDELGIGAPNYNIGYTVDLLNSLNYPIATGALWDTFENVGGVTLENNLTAIFNTGKTDRHRAHLLNGTCITNNKCWAGDLLNGYSWGKAEQEAKTPGSRLNSIICNQAKKVQSYAILYPGIKFYVAGLLEHHLSLQAATAVTQTIKSCFPDAILVDSPGPNAPYTSVPGALSERHGLRVGQICSLDGSTVEDVDVVSWLKACGNSEITFVWGQCKNGRNNSGVWTQPNNRNSFCTNDQTLWHNALRFPQDAAPSANVSFCKGVTFVQSPAIWKTSAEDKGTGDPRANKPLLISKFNSSWDILGADGFTIGALGFYGSFDTPGYYRAYSGQVGGGQSAYQLSLAAKQHGGTTWAFLRNRGSGFCYLVDTLRRSGTYRTVKKPKKLKAVRRPTKPTLKAGPEWEPNCDLDCNG